MPEPLPFGLADAKTRPEGQISLMAAASPFSAARMSTPVQFVAEDPSITSPNSSHRSPVNFISCICSIG